MNEQQDIRSSGPAPPSGSLPEPAGTRRLVTQLVLFPLLLVLLLLGGWTFVFWLLHEDQDAASLVRRMQEPDRRAWQSAYTLSQMLGDPDQTQLKHDVELCRELAAILTKQNRLAAASADGGGEEHANFRLFLCRALGAFDLADGLPALSEAARPAPGMHASAVRSAALQSLAVLTGTLGVQAVLAHPEVLSTALEASREGDRDKVELAASAAYLLGLLGGPEATERLNELLADRRENVRYNAATGLARQGRAEALVTLLEMLAPEAWNSEAWNDAPSSPLARRNQERQVLVTSNAIRATVMLYSSASASERREIKQAWERLYGTATAPSYVRQLAEEALHKCSHLH